MLNDFFKQALIVLGSPLDLLFPPAHAQSMPPVSPELMNYGMIVLIFLVMYFLVIRPQSKKAKMHQQMITTLRRGDQVLTAGGIIGTVHKVDGDQEILVDIAEGVRVRIAKATVTQVISKTEPLKPQDSDLVQDEPIDDPLLKKKKVVKTSSNLGSSHRKVTKPK